MPDYESQRNLSPSKADNRSLGAFQLSLLIFFAVSGGPYGAESSLAAAPPNVVLLLFVTLPWIWSLPIGLCTSELASAFPDENGGMIEWVLAAGGRVAGKIASLFYYFSCATDNALYAILLPHYLQNSFGIVLSSFSHFLISASMVIFVGYINIKGVDTVATSSLFFGFLVLLPLIILMIFSTPYINPDVWFSSQSPTTDQKIHWNVLLSIVVWCNRFEFLCTLNLIFKWVR